MAHLRLRQTETDWILHSWMHRPLQPTHNVVRSWYNKQRLHAKYFIDFVRQVPGTPSIVRADRGTENVRVAGIQRFLRRNDEDLFSGNSSFMYG